MWGLDVHDFWAGVMTLIVVAYIIWIGDTFLMLVGAILVTLLCMLAVSILGRLIRIVMGDVDV